MFVEKLVFSSPCRFMVQLTSLFIKLLLACFNIAIPGSSYLLLVSGICVIAGCDWNEGRLRSTSAASC